ncbi:MAG TPA: FAD-linked oxidase C-terminal domain-containing protein [Bryobacteraceae bacterium]|nr:FAD-linked oxidase C-terminal domain-containing protein [Bryobacteraceae bacterium]
MFVTIQEAHKQIPPRHRSGDAIPSYAEELGQVLARRVQGEVRFNDGDRALYSTDGSNYRQTPIGVVLPKTKEDVIATVTTCREFGAPVLSRGGGTSLAGQCCNVAVVMDFSKYMNRVVWLDPNKRQAAVEPGIVLDDLRNAAEKYNLTFGPDPATHTHCTLGGMIGNNSCGVHALMAGKTSENIDELEILLYDGTRLRVGATSDNELEQIIREGGRRGDIYRRLKTLRDKYADEVRRRFPNIPRRVSGYNLDKLLPENGFHVAQALVGTEATCVTVLEAVTRLVSSPPYRALLVLGYRDVFSAADAVPELLENEPIGLEGFDDLMVSNMRMKSLMTHNLGLLPKGNGWLMVEFGGNSTEEAEDHARRLMDKLKQKGDKAPHAKLFDNPEETKHIWEVRESALGATSWVPGQPPAWEGWEDSAVPPDRLGDYLRDLCGLYKKYDYLGAFYGHFGQACVHTRITFDLFTEPGIEKWRRYMKEAVDLVVRYGGSLSGEHGDGQARAEYLPDMFGPELVKAFEEFKDIWDPQNKMNPGKVVYPYRIDENLRYGSDLRLPPVKTHFQFPEDNGDFGKATMRCVGVGRCRREHAGVMCPSYMVTREEKHSTRGRARLLFEMMSGDVLEKGWKSEAVKDALDLCLACKGCKGQCPVNVDMATYKAEFLSHYYDGKLRPRSAYAVGLIYWWARLASLAPGIVNFLSHAPGLSSVAKAIAGVHQKRTLPAFARRTFKDWFAQHRKRNQNGPKVMLWPDTFTNHWHPEHGAAVTEVLEQLGYHVLVPKASLCCGRPLYDFGMLDTAKKMLQQILDALHPAIEKGIPLVGIEPSCLAVFRDELYTMFPNNPDAKRLRESAFTLGEFIERHGHLDQLPPLHRKAIVQRHCQHEAVMKFDADRRVLEAIGLDHEILDSGCCGMAGGFGYEADHYDVSVACGERVLLPKVREVGEDTLIIADGFSCESQIEQQTGRTAVHLGQVLQMAFREGARPKEPYGAYVKDEYSVNRDRAGAAVSWIGAGTVAGLAALGLWKAVSDIRRRS